MEDQDSILNELLERIKLMEKKNEDLRLKIEQKRQDISTFDVNTKQPEKLQKLDISEIKLRKIPTPEEDEIEAKKALANFRNVKFNKIQFESNIMEYTIEYTSQEQHNNLYIMGDFTKWELLPMKKNKDTFTYKVILLKGFKYFYSFQSGDQIFLDYNNVYEENPRTLQIQNLIDLTEGNKEIYFDYKTDYNILETLEKNYLMTNIDINEDEFLFLTKLKNHGVIYREISKVRKEKHNQISNDIILYYENHYKYLNPFLQIK